MEKICIIVRLQKNSASVSYLVFCNGGILVNDNKAGHTIRMGLNTK